MGVRDITLDAAVMAHVVSGALDQGSSTVERSRVLRVAQWYYWVDGQLWLEDASHGPRRVPPLGERRQIMVSALEALGYPGGGRLYEALRLRYYWAGMRGDCQEVASAQLPYQVEAAKFKPPRFITPTWKG